MNSQGDINRKSNIIIYTTEDGLAKIDTTFDGQAIWLTIDQMVKLFQTDRSVIASMSEVFLKKGNCLKESVWAKFAYAAADGKA